MLSRVIFFADIGRGYARGVARGIATYAAAHARSTWMPMVASMDAVDLLEDRKMHNIIGAIGVECRGLEHASKIGLPAVCISGLSKECPIQRVRSDDVAIGVIVADHLISAGLQNFAYYGSTSSVYYSDRRNEGFCRRLSENGHSLVPWFCNDQHSQWEADLADWLMNLAKPVGIMADCDDSGALVIAACRELGLRIPDDVAVVGVDNDDVVCESTFPTMSSVPHEAGNVGYQAAGILMRLIGGDKKVPPLTLVAPRPVVVRGSSDGLFMTDQLVREAVAFLRQHFADRIKIQAVAEAVCVCRKTLDVRFTAALGHTPADELRRLQVNHAKQLLQTTDLPMSVVAESAGFSTARQFSESFHRETKLTPTEFRRSNRFVGKT